MESRSSSVGLYCNARRPLVSYHCFVVDDSKKTNGNSTHASTNGIEADAEESDDDKEEDGGTADVAGTGGRFLVLAKRGSTDEY